MRHSPSMVPSGGNRDTYLVLDDLGRFGRVWRETAEADANHETLIRDLLDDQYSRPTRIVAFNTTEGLVSRRDLGHRRRTTSTFCRVP